MTRSPTIAAFRRISAVAALVVGMLVGVAVVPFGQPRVEAEPAQPAYAGAPYFAPGAVYTKNFPDPSILFDPGTDLYYAYGTTTGGVNVPVMTSPDAVTWTARSRHAISNPNGEYHDGLPDPSPPGWPWQSGDARFPDDLWAPGVAKLGSRWVMFYALRENQAGRRCIVYATSAGPAGPYGDPKRFSCSGDPLGSIDPQPFTDPVTGVTSLVWKDEGLVGSHGQRIWARAITLVDDTTVAYAPGSETQFLLESQNTWEAYVAESPTPARLPDGSLGLFYSGNRWDSDRYATGLAVCPNVGFTWTPQCTRVSSGPLLSRRAGRVGIGGPSATVGRNGELLLATHSWAEGAPASYPANQRRLVVERVSQVDGRIVISGDPGPVGPAPPSTYVPATPVRVLDTRNGLGTTSARTLEAGEVLALDLAGRVPATTSAVVLNLTVVAPASGGFVTAYPCGTPPNASNVNYVPGQVVADLVTVQVSPARGVCLYTYGATHLVADLQGTYDTSTAGGFTGVVPSRLLDSRASTSLGAGGVVEIPVRGRAGVSADATAVAVNLTATGAARDGWLTAWPCTASRPLVSNVNFGAGTTVANAAVVPLSATGSVCVFAESPTDVIVDVFGFTGPTGTLMRARAPVRLLDTRVGGPPVAAGRTITQSVVGGTGAPAGTMSVVLTLTATDVRGPGWLSVFPCSAGGSPGEQTSNLNVATGDTRAAHVTVPVSPDGTICIYTRSASHMIVDLAGSFG